MNHHVYCLLRRGEHRPFYIGVTTNSRQRLCCHTARFGKHLDLVVLETLDNSAEASMLESDLIQWYMGRGVRLVNKETAPCYHEQSPKTRLAMNRAVARRARENKEESQETERRKEIARRALIEARKQFFGT